MGDPIKAEVDRLLAKDKECKSYSFGELTEDGLVGFSFKKLNIMMSVCRLC